MSLRPAAALGSLALLASVLVAGCGDSDAGSGDGSGDAASGPACDWQSSDQAAKDVSPPADHATETGEVPVVISTDAGDIGATLDADAAPCTVSSFVSLATQGYFDDTPCHRLTTPASGISVLQCGDPTGTGMGGPGYTIPDETTGSETYPAGTIAMARTSEPHSGGSQFFLVYDATQLKPDYTVFGHLDDDGLAVVRQIAQQGVAGGGADGSPAEPVTIRSVDVED